MPTIIMCVAIYLAFGWLSLFVAGMLDFDVFPKHMIFFFYPFVWMFVLAVAVVDTLVHLVTLGKNKSPSIRRYLLWGDRILHCVKMIFDPYELGLVVVKKIEQMKIRRNTK